MRKLAVFVEGLTEQEFVITLVKDLVGARGLNIEIKRQYKNVLIVEASQQVGNQEFYLLLVNCANDEQVLTKIRDNYAGLVAGGYDAILGLRDLFPLAATELGFLQSGIAASTPIGEIPVEVHIAVMETEAWFIAESTHFERISPNLSSAAIAAAGINLTGIPVESIAHPAETLDKIYKIVGARYLTRDGKKSGSRIKRTVRALSVEGLYVTVRANVPEFAKFLNSIERAFF